MSKYNYVDRDLARKFMEDFRDMKKYGNLTDQEIKDCNTIFDNDVLRKGYQELYHLDQKQRAEQTGPYTLTMGENGTGTVRELDEREGREIFQQGIGIGTAGAAGAIGLGLGLWLSPDNPAQQLAMGKMVGGVGEMGLAAAEAHNTKTEFREEIRHGLGFKEVGEIEPAPVAPELEQVKAETKEGDKPEAADGKEDEAQPQPEKQHQEPAPKTEKQEANIDQQNQLYKPTDYIVKNATQAAEPLYVPPTVGPLRTDAQPIPGIQRIPGIQAIPGVPGTQMPNTIPIKQTGEKAMLPGALLQPNTAVDQTKEVTADRKDAAEQVDGRAPQGALLQPNTALNQVKDKAPEVKVQEKTDAPGGG